MNPQAIQFRAKPKAFHYFGEDAPRYMYVDVPALERKHCDMSYFRQHPKFGPYANSDLFKAMLARELARIGKQIRLDQLPEGVKVKEGFLLTVSIAV